MLVAEELASDDMGSTQSPVRPRPPCPTLG